MAAFAIVVLLRIVIECSLARRGFRPRYYPVVSGHTTLTCASLNYLNFVDYVTAVDANLNVTIVVVFAFKHTP